MLLNPRENEIFREGQVDWGVIHSSFNKFIDNAGEFDIF
jgi:hypothetical protein